MTFHLEKVEPNSNQINFLYKQMERRVYNISHNDLPSIAEHVMFVKNNCYREWFIIKKGTLNIGNIYVQFDNSIGLHCLKEISASEIKCFLQLVFEQVEPLEAIPSFRRGSFFLNVASSNIHMQDCLTSIGCSEIQRSYEISNLVKAEIKER